MNFSVNEQTGMDAELAVARLFNSWGWSVGRYQIDAGYDYTVMPSRNRFKGRSFLVQVKGTAQKKRSRTIVAPVEKFRLRQYAEDADPVFILRSTGDQTLYWLHAQRWCQANRERLEGSGTSGVRLDPVNRLVDRQAFEAYLEDVFRDTREQSLARTDFAEASGLLKGGLNSRLQIAGSGPSRAIDASLSEGEEVKLTFLPRKSKENFERLRDAVHFGLPRTVEVEDLKLTAGSVSQDSLLLGPMTGRLTVRPTSHEMGALFLHPGRKRSVSVQSLRIDAELFRGTQGVAVSTDGVDSLFDLAFRLTPESLGKPATLTIGMRLSSLHRSAIQHLHDLGPIALWADQVIAHKGLHAELSFSPGRVSLTPAADNLDELESFVFIARTMGRLHLVARTLDSNYTIPLGFDVSLEEMGDIDLAFALLKGERRSVGVGSFDFDPKIAFASVKDSLLLITSNFVLSLGDDVVGSIPVSIELTGYQIEPIEGSSRFRVAKGTEGQAWIYHDEHGHRDGKIVRHG